MSKQNSSIVEVDKFASLLLEEAKRFLEKSRDCDEESAETAGLHASLMLAFCSLEAHLNAIANDFERRAEYSPHDCSVLFEREVRLEDGEFVAKENTLKMWRLEDRIQFLHKRLSAKPVDKTASWWSDLAGAIDLRNELTHPKKVPVITGERVTRAVQAIIDTLSALYVAIYRKKFPASGRGLNSELDF